MISSLLVFTSTYGDEVYFKNGQVWKNCRIVDSLYSVVRIQTSANRNLLIVEKDRIDSISVNPFDPSQPTIQITRDGTGTETDIVLTENTPLLHYYDGKMVIMKKSGEQVVGSVLYITDSLLVLWQNIYFFDWRKKNDVSGKYLHYSLIDKIVLTKEGGSYWSGFFYGALAGGGLGLVVGFSSGSGNGAGGDPIPLGRLPNAVLYGTGLAVFGGMIGGSIGAYHRKDDEHYVRGEFQRYRTIVRALKKDAERTSSLSSEQKVFIELNILEKR